MFDRESPIRILMGEEEDAQAFVERLIAEINRLQKNTSLATISRLRPATAEACTQKGGSNYEVQLEEKVDRLQIKLANLKEDFA